MRTKEELLAAIESAENEMYEDRAHGMDIFELAHKYEYLSELRKELNEIWAQEAINSMHSNYVKAGE